MNLRVLDGSATGYAVTQNRVKSSARYNLRSNNQRPLIVLEPTEYPLAVEQHGGSRSNGSNKLSPPGVIPNALLIG